MVSPEAPKSTLRLLEGRYPCPAGVESKNFTILRKYSMLVVTMATIRLKKKVVAVQAVWCMIIFSAFLWSCTVCNVTVEFQWTENGMPEWGIEPQSLAFWASIIPLGDQGGGPLWQSFPFGKSVLISAGRWICNLEENVTVGFNKHNKSMP